MFLHEPRNYHNLDISEHKWTNKLKAKINLNLALLPKFFDTNLDSTVGNYFFILRYIFIEVVSSPIYTNFLSVGEEYIRKCVPNSQNGFTESRRSACSNCLLCLQI